MDAKSRRKSVNNGLFLDPCRFRKALGEEVFQSLRYFEMAVEVIQDDQEKAPKHFHRCVLLSEAVLFVLDASKKECKKNLWASEGANPPIFLKDVLLISAIAKRSEIFAEDELNKKVRHFEIFYNHTTPTGQTEKRRIEIAAWESGSLLLNQIKSAWTNLIVRLCLGIEISIHLDIQDSKSVLFELYQDLVHDITTSLRGKPRLLIASVNELAQSALHETELKTLFFTLPALFQHLVADLLHSELPPELHNNERDGQLVKIVAVPWESRSQQLEYVLAIMRLFHAMTFNSQTIPERSNLLSPAPYSFVELLRAFTLQFDKRAVERELHRMEAAKRAKEDEDGQQFFRSFPSTPKQQDQTRKDRTHETEAAEEEDSSEDEFEYDSDYEDGVVEMKDYHSGDKSSHKNKKSDPTPSRSISSQGGGLIRSIAEEQVAVLVELDDFISLAVSQGRSRSVVSETLANQLAKAGGKFCRYSLPAFVRNLVHLLQAWGERRKTTRKDRHAIAVRIFQHVKLLHMLVLGNYQMVEVLIERCEEELKYYILKQSTFEALTQVDSDSSGFLQVPILNRQTKAMLEEINETITELKQRQQRQRKEASVLLI